MSGLPAEMPAFTTPPPGDRPTPLADLFEASFAVYRKNFIPLVVLSAVTAVPGALWFVVIGALQADLLANVVDDLRVSMARGSYEPLAIRFSPVLIALLVLSFVVLLLIGVLYFVAVTHVTLRAHDQLRTPIPEAVRAAARHGLRAVALTVLTYLLAVGLGVGFGAVALALAAAGAPQLVVLLGAVVLGLITWFAVASRLSVAIPVLVAEAVGPVTAITRAWSVTRGSTLRAAALLILTGLVISVANLVAAPFLTPATTDILLGEVTAWYVLAIVATAAVSAVAAPILPIVLTIFYLDLRRRSARWLPPGQATR